MLPADSASPQTPIQRELANFQVKAIVAQPCARLVLLADHATTGRPASRAMINAKPTAEVATDDQTRPPDPAAFPKARPKIGVATKLNPDLEGTPPPLESIGKLLADARHGRYAIGHFESWNLQSLPGAFEAANAIRAPVIIGFNGNFLCRPGRQLDQRLAANAEPGLAAARSAPAPGCTRRPCTARSRHRANASWGCLVSG